MRVQRPRSGRGSPAIILARMPRDEREETRARTGRGALAISSAASSAHGWTRSQPPARRPSCSSSRCGCTSFERFFRIKNQPALRARDARSSRSRNWSEELRLVDNVILRVVQLCSADPDRGAGQPHALRPVRRGLPQEGRRASTPTSRSWCGSRRPRPALTLLRESFEDLHLLLIDLVQAVAHPLRHLHLGGQDRLPRDPAQRPPRAADRQEVQAHPRPHHQPEGGRGRSAGSGPDSERQHAAKVFLEFFRLLHYLEYADPEHHRRGRACKNTILIFSLITSETRLLLSYIEKRALRGPGRRRRRSTSSTTPSSTASRSSSRR